MHFQVIPNVFMITFSAGFHMPQICILHFQ